LTHSTEESPKQAKIVIPYYLTPDHILGLLEVLESLGGYVDPMFIGDFLSESIDLLPLVIDIAQALDFIHVDERGNIELTKLGKEVVRGNVKQVKNILKSRSDSVEPLKTILEHLKKKKRISVEEFDDILSNFYGQHLPEAKITVLQWGAFLGLFKMNPEDTHIIRLT